jgi:hypothetical protein
VDFWQRAPDLLLELRLDLMRLLEADVAGQLRDDVRVNPVVTVA